MVHPSLVGGIVVGIIAYLIVFSLGAIIQECGKNSDCKENNYCGSDNSCHPFPQAPITIVKYNLILPALILGVAVIVSAYVLKK